ncbi:SPOR domain-containing protein [Maricaulis sp. CAU 1757]
MKFLPVFISLLAVTACASAPDAQPSNPYALPLSAPPTAQMDREARLAMLTGRELMRLAQEDPLALDQVEAELVALSLALAGAPVAEPQSAARNGAEWPEAPTALETAPSVMHAVHLASYRSEAMAAAGWLALQARFEGLAGLEPRLEAADLAERGRFLRLKAGPFDSREEARRACVVIEAAGEYCRAVDFTGRRMADNGPGQGD